MFTIISNLTLLVLMISLLGYWIYSVATYDWSNFDQDQEQAKRDLF